MEKFFTRMLCKLVFSLRKVPNTLRTEAVCREFILKYRRNFKHVPPENLSEDMCYAMVIQSSLLTEYRDGMPFSTPGHVRERAEIMISQALNAYNEDNPIPFANLPDDWFNDDLMTFILRCRGGFLALPDRRKTLDITIDAIKQDNTIFEKLSQEKQEEVVRKELWRLSEVKDIEVLERLFPFAMQKDYTYIDKIPTERITESLIRSCMQAIVGKPLPDNPYEGMLDFLISQRIRLELLPLHVNRAVTDYICKNISKDNFERFSDALKPDTYKSDLVRFVIDCVDADYSRAYSEYFESGDDFDSRTMLKYFRSKVLCAHLHPDQMASLCNHESHWMAFQTIYGSEVAMSYNPSMKSKFASRDMGMD